MPHVAATTPYPWPYDGDLAGAATALIVVAAADTVRADVRLRDAVERLASAVDSAGGLVVAATTARAPRRARGADARVERADSLDPADSPEHLGHPARSQAGPVGGGALGLLAGAMVDEVVLAGGIDAFYGSDLDLLLRTRRIERLLLAGIGLETCVHSTMRTANDRGYECLLVVDACASGDPGLVPAAVSMIEMSGGIFGAVGRSADVLAALSPADLTPEGAST